MDDSIKLVTTGYTFDSAGNQIPTRSEREVLCQVLSVGRSEFYQAAQNGLHPEYVFKISHYKDYEGEKEVVYRAWGGNEKIYDVIRTYKAPDSDAVELTVQERIGNGRDSSGN